MQVRNFQFFYSSRIFYAPFRERRKREREREGERESEREREDRIKKTTKTLLLRNFSLFSLFLNVYDWEFSFSYTSHEYTTAAARRRREMIWNFPQFLFASRSSRDYNCAKGSRLKMYRLKCAGKRDL